MCLGDGRRDNLTDTSARRGSRAWGWASFSLCNFIPSLRIPQSPSRPARRAASCSSLPPISILRRRAVDNGATISSAGMVQQVHCSRAAVCCSVASSRLQPSRGRAPARARPLRRRDTRRGHIAAGKAGDVSWLRTLVLGLRDTDSVGSFPGRGCRKHTCSSCRCTTGLISGEYVLPVLLRYYTQGCVGLAKC